MVVRSSLATAVPARNRETPMSDTPVAAALAAFRASGSPWLALPFFAGDAADAVAARVDARIAAGARVLPAPADIFRALAETPLPAVRAVILGQDPYPTPGDANGLAFSYVGSGRLPASLRVILAEAGSERSRRRRPDALGPAGRTAPQQRAHRRGRQGRCASALWLVGADRRGRRGGLGASGAGGLSALGRSGPRPGAADRCGAPRRVRERGTPRRSTEPGISRARTRSAGPTAGWPNAG